MDGQGVINIYNIYRYLHGQMVEDIKENIKMIKKKDMVNLNGQMEE